MATDRVVHNEFEDVFAIIKKTFEHLLTKPGLILMTVLVAVVLWGPRGTPIFSGLFDSWVNADPGESLWRTQLVSYGVGVLLLVIIPMLLIRYRFKEPLSNFGLGLGNTKLGLALFGLLIVISVPFFFLGAKDAGMQAEYPLLYRGLNSQEILARFTWQNFLLFELVYASFFFVIEFTFRGFLLFGLKEKFGLYAVLFQMLSYTAWHLTKPTAELIGTPIWGFAVAAVSLRAKSMWYVLAAHWLLNIFLDILILHNRGVV